MIMLDPAVDTEHFHKDFKTFLFTGHYGPLVMPPIRGIYVIVPYKPIFTYLLTSD